MPEATITTDSVPIAARERVGPLAKIAVELAGDNLLGLTLFGPVLTDEYDPNVTLVTSVAVLKRIDLNFLRRLADRGLELGKQRISAPLIMTPEYVKDSLDAFPLELIEIHQKRATIFGEDHFTDISPAPEHVRLQCERELKRILIRVRQGLLAAAGRQNALTELLADVGQHALRTLRGMLWLHGEKDYHAPPAVLERIEKGTGRSYPGLRHVLRVGALLEPGDVDTLYADIESLAKVANDFA